jgi:5-formyltetrahydrofolate cyclo-ligase
MNKAQLRQDIKHRLAAITPDERDAKSRRICRCVVDSEPFGKAGVVMMFLSLPHEVDTTAMILAAWRQGKTVVVPKISWEQRHMIPVEITSLETGLQKDRMGLRTPVSGLPVPFEDIDLVVTPGLGFDRAGIRLGRGGAYYDRFFAGHADRIAKWGVCFSEQICPEVPHDASDVPMDAIVTDEEVIYCV